MYFYEKNLEKNRSSLCPDAVRRAEPHRQPRGLGGGPAATGARPIRRQPRFAQHCPGCGRPGVSIQKNGRGTFIVCDFLNLHPE